MNSKLYICIALSLAIFAYLIMVISQNKRRQVVLLALSLLMASQINILIQIKKRPKKLVEILNKSFAQVKDRPSSSRNQFLCMGKIAICMFYTPNIASYSELCTEINRTYADIHGYDLILFTKPFDDSCRAPQWNKIKAVSKCLEFKSPEGKSKYDYVFWIDSDAYFNRHDCKIEDLIDEYSDFTICQDDQSSLVNTGTFIFKNTAWSRNFLDFWWQAGENSSFAQKYFHEQQVLEGIFYGDMMGVKSKIDIRPAREFNSYGKDVFKKSTGWEKTFIVHMMGQTDEKRKANLISFLKKKSNEKNE